MLPLPAGHVGAIGSSFGYSSVLRRASADFIHCYAAGGTPIHPLPSLAPSGRLHPLPSSWRDASLFCFSCCCFCFYNVLRDSCRRSRSTDSLPLSLTLSPSLSISPFPALSTFVYVLQGVARRKGKLFLTARSRDKFFLLFGFVIYFFAVFFQFFCCFFLFFFFCWLWRTLGALCLKLDKFCTALSANEAA